MPAYSYQALDAQGQPLKGTLEADSPRSARAQLRLQALIPLAVEEITNGNAASRVGSQNQAWLWSRRTLSPSDLAIWIRQLAGLVGAGLPLERAIASFAHEAENEAVRQLMAALRAEVNAGSSFAAALSQYPREFSPILVAVVAAGEQSGNLGLVLDRLADDLEERELLKDKLMSAALYPAVVTLVAVVIVAFLMGYVVPQVATVFAGTHRSLPLLTVMMLAISEFVRHWGWAVLILLSAAAFAGARLLRREEARLAFDTFCLRVPILGHLARGYNAARFAGTLAMLSAAGVPILRALQSAADTLQNQAMRRDALDALSQVREGASLATALAQKRRFPGILSLFSRLGEQTGELPTMLQRAARQLSLDVHRRATQLATLLEPLLIVAMGIIVLLIVLAVLLPIIQMNQWGAR